MLPEPLGNRIRRFRLAADLAQVDLASRMQARGHQTISRQRIQEIENGQRVVKPNELVSLARILGVSITELLGVPDNAPE